MYFLVTIGCSSFKLCRCIDCLNKTVRFRPNKKISVFWVMGLKILGRVGTLIFLNHYLFLEKYIILCILNA